MRRPALGTLAFLTAAAACLISAAPASASASATAAVAVRHSTVRPDGVLYIPTGYTYPDTPAGLASCNAEGMYYKYTLGDPGYQCLLGNPMAGYYNLWVAHFI